MWHALFWHITRILVLEMDPLPQGLFKAIEKVETDFPDYFGAENG